MNLKSIYNAKAWVQWLTSIAGFLSIALSVVPQKGKIYVAVASIYAAIQGILAQLTKAGVAVLVLVLLASGTQRASASNERVFVKPLLLMDAKGHLTQAEFIAYPKMHEAFLITRDRVVLVRQSGENPFQAILDKFGCTMLFALKAHGQITGAVITPVMHIWDNSQKGLSLDGDAFAGLKGKELAPATGLLLMGTWTPLKWGNFFIQAGAGLQLVQSRPVDMVFAAGAGYRTKY